MGYRRQQLADDRDDEVVNSARPAYKFTSRKHRLGPRVRGGVCAWFAALVVTSACSFTPVAPPPVPDTEELVIGIPEATTSAEETGVNQVASLLSFESLTENSSDGRPRPRLAERWQWEADDRQLRVFLRPDVVLHNGEPLTADVAAELVRRAVTSPGNVARYTSFRDIAAVRTDGPFQLVFDLIRPSAMLPDDLTVPLNTDAEGMGTGAYRIVTSEPDEVVLEAWNRYYRGKPSIPRVVLRPFDTLRTTWASLLRGEVDVVYDVPADAVEFIRNDDVQVVTVPRWYQFAIAFNAESPALRSPEVRRALNMAIDRDELVDNILRGAGSPSYGPLWPDYWAYDRSMVPPSFDPQRAASLLDEAGLTLRSGSANEPPARLRFTCLLPANFAVWERIALKVQKDLFDVGVDMKIEVLPFDKFSDRIVASEFDAVLLDLISGPIPGRAYILWASKERFAGLYNVFGYENAESEKLFEVLRASHEEGAVRSATRRLQRVMVEDPPALFLAWSERSRAIGRDILIPKTEADVMWTLWNWSRSTDRVASR